MLKIHYMSLFSCVPTSTTTKTLESPIPGVKNTIYTPSRLPKGKGFLIMKRPWILLVVGSVLAVIGFFLTYIGIYAPVALILIGVGLILAWFWSHLNNPPPPDESHRKTDMPKQPDIPFGPWNG
jgi:hypothetical protein